MFHSVLKSGRKTKVLHSTSFSVKKCFKAGKDMKNKIKKIVEEKLLTSTINLKSLDIDKAWHKMEERINEKRRRTNLIATKEIHLCL